jgi:tight adherence protein B
VGALIGLVLGIGVVLVLWSVADPAPRRRDTRRGLRTLLDGAGLAEVSVGRLLGLCAGSFVVAALVMTVVSRVLVVGLVFGALAALLPVATLRGRARRRAREHADLWPDAVDNLASAVRAGLSLPEAVVQLGERGPEGLRDPFVRFGRDYQSSGRFEVALDRLKDRLADPTGDRVVEALRLARDVGGGDLGRMLRSLSGFLREEARTRGELEARQSWTVNAAHTVCAWILDRADTYWYDRYSQCRNLRPHFL